MPPYGEADWATPGGNTNASVTDAVTPGATASPVLSVAEMGGSSGRQGGGTKFYIVGLSMLCIGMAAMMGALGVISFIDLLVTAKIDDLTALFLSAYMVLFATLLFLYEIIWWTPIAYINIMFRKNFGFLYGLNGKGLYMIFIAFLTLGLIDDNKNTIFGLDWITGVGWLVTGVLHIFVSCSVPGSNDAYKPPTAGLSTLGGTDGAATTNDFNASTTV